MERPAFSLGVEEEFQITDPVTRELRSHVQEILDEGIPGWYEKKYPTAVTAPGKP